MNKCCNLKCKNKNILFIKNNYYCKNHIVLNFNKFIIKIQKMYKGYKTRKTLKNIYYKLPQDIQTHILYFINKSIYQKKYNKTIRNIINKKNYDIILHPKIQNKLNINLIKNIYYLTNKYRSILFLNDIKCLYVYGEEIINILHNYVVQLFTDENNFLLESNNIIIDIKDSSVNDIIDTITIIYNFRTNYNKEINIIKNNYIYY